ncbi:hypothetical protein BDZ91DRAFT_795647 [Kalaharituber pfeilii]|nr:hypothetical protein BDZ91DRAFT_795647 [Kalaharituber pfeilii]
MERPLILREGVKKQERSLTSHPHYQSIPATTPHINYTPIAVSPAPLTSLNSNDNPHQKPEWLAGKGIKEPDPLSRGRKIATAADREYTMIRFVDGELKVMFFSEHSNGVAVAFEAVEKIGKRPVTYVAYGAHANYPAAGGLDLRLSLCNLELGGANRLAHFDGHWGNKQLPVGDQRQYGVWRAVGVGDGPSGPKWKELQRAGLCSDGEMEVKDGGGSGGERRDSAGEGMQGEEGDRMEGKRKV